jgi:hypothetical protein
MIEQHFFESTELIHTHEIEKNTKKYVSSELLAVHYNRYDKKLVSKQTKK